MTENATIATAQAATARQRVYRGLHRSGAAAGTISTANLFIMALIILNVIALVAETTPAGSAYARQFRWFDVFSVLVFTVEYVLRLWSVSEDARYSDGWRGRARYAATPMAIVDLLAILPFYLPAQALDLRSLRLLRLFRLLRIAKLARYSVALDVLGGVLKEKKPELTLLVAIVLVLVLCSGSVMYFIERDVQPDVFSSIPHAAWWSIVTLTTIGYGDIVPTTAGGKVIGALVALFGVGIVALPAGMLGAAFTEALARRRSAADACPHCGQPSQPQRD